MKESPGNSTGGFADASAGIWRHRANNGMGGKCIALDAGYERGIEDWV